MHIGYPHGTLYRILLQTETGRKIKLHEGNIWCKLTLKNLLLNRQPDELLIFSICPQAKMVYGNFHMVVFFCDYNSLS